MKPTLHKIVITDFLTMICLLAPMVVLILGVDNRYFGFLSSLLSRGKVQPGEAHGFFFVSSLVLALILIPFAVFRIHCFRQWFKESIVVRGVVTCAPAVKDRGTFAYVYALNGKEYRSWNLVHRTKHARSIEPGDEVEIVVYKKNPRKAFIKRLYVET